MAGAEAHISEITETQNVRSTVAKENRCLCWCAWVRPTNNNIPTYVKHALNQNASLISALYKIEYVPF
jgi:hypothetical protein